MPARLAAAHDSEASGPRDWPELAAMRAVHRTMRHAAIRARLDTARADRPRTGPAHAAKLVDAAHRRAAIARILRRAATMDSATSTARDLASAQAAAAIRDARAARRATRAPWPIDPCPVSAPRCPGHARMIDAAATRQLARDLHPIRPVAPTRTREAA